jgi:hypothetical protein
MTDAAAPLNPMQQAVLDALARPPGWMPLPGSVIEAISAQVTEGLAPLADSFTPEEPLFVTKAALGHIHACEAHYLAQLGTFAWTLENARGTVVHKAIELAIHWRGPVEPAEVVDEAIARLSDEEGHGPSDFLEQLRPAERAQLRSFVVDRFTKFDECFPPLKAAWRPVTESSARVELLGGAVRLSTRVDLTLGAPGSKVIIDLKSGRIFPQHREDLRFYALVDALRSGQAPRLLATYSLDSARPDVEQVTEGVLQAAARRLVDGALAMSAVQREEREATRTAGPPCRWCPIADDCAPGRAYLAGPEED